MDKARCLGACAKDPCYATRYADFSTVGKDKSWLWRNHAPRASQWCNGSKFKKQFQVQDIDIKHLFINIPFLFSVSLFDAALG